MKFSKPKLALLGLSFIVVFLFLNATLKEPFGFVFVLDHPPEYRFGYNTKIVDSQKAFQQQNPDYAKQECLKLESSGFIWDDVSKSCIKRQESTQTAQTAQQICIKNKGTWDFRNTECVFGSPTTSSGFFTKLVDFVTGQSTPTTQQTPPPQFTAISNARCATQLEAMVTAIEYSDYDNDGDLDETFKGSTLADTSELYPKGVLGLNTNRLGTGGTDIAYYDLNFFVQCKKATNIKLYTSQASELYITVKSQNSKDEEIITASGKYSITQTEIPDNKRIKIGTVRINAIDIEKNLDVGFYDSIQTFFAHGKLVMYFEGHSSPNELYNIEIPMAKNVLATQDNVKVEKETPSGLKCTPPLVEANGKCIQPLGNEPPIPEGTFPDNPLGCFDTTFTSDEFYDCLGQKKFIGLYMVLFGGLVILLLIFRKPRQVMIAQAPSGY